MGKPISAVGASAAAVTQPSQSTPVQQTPSQSPTQSQPNAFWPPAYGWRLSALEGERSAHNSWQKQWLEQGSAIAGAGAVDSVGALKPQLDPHLVRPNGRPHNA